MKQPAVTQGSEFGKTKDGAAVQEFVLSNGHGMKAKVLTYGGIVRELWVPDKKGESKDIVLGFKDLADYEERSPYFGAIAGRVANRIARGSFTLDGKSFTLATNNGPNHLHGGVKGFDKAVWKVDGYTQNADNASLALSYVSADGEEGYPGAVTVRVRYDLTSGNELTISYDADSTKATPINLTSHSYFNLAGHGLILDHKLQLAADSYTPVDETLIPTGEIKSVAGTPFDFRAPKRIGADIGKVEGGYDHNFVLRGMGEDLAPVARVSDPESGRVMEISSTEPGVQFYTGNFLDGSLVGKDGARYLKNSGFCLETQHFPDSVHHKSFPSVILRPGEHFHSVTVHRFLAE